MEDALERASAAVSFQESGLTRGLELRIIGRTREINHGGIWDVKEPRDIASGNAGGLFDFSKTPNAKKGAVPNVGSYAQRDGHKAGTEDIVNNDSA